VLVRVTHWITVISFVALLVTGVEILISHPRFYWGEVGNSLTRPLFQIPIPSSRATVPTSYGYVLPDQNGWSRYLKKCITARPQQTPVPGTHINRIADLEKDAVLGANHPVPQA
jgi:Prokaryotic cytochrome b561